MPCGVATTDKDRTKPVSDRGHKQRLGSLTYFSIGLFVMFKNNGYDILKVK